MAVLAWFGGAALHLGEFRGVASLALRLLPLIAAAAVLYFGALWVLRAPEVSFLRRMSRPQE
jgi:hypothetical protein